MIFGWVRLAIIGFVVLTVVYLVIGLYSRSVRREKLEKEWDSTPVNEGQGQGPRQDFIDDGMKAYEKGLKKRLLWLIYILPAAAFVATVYTINWS